MQPPVYLHMIEIDFKQWTNPVKILVSEQIGLATIFYFGQVFIFCMLISKNVLEQILLIQRTYSDQIYIASQQKPSHITFFIKNRRSADAQYLLSTLRSEIQKRPFADIFQIDVLKNRSMFTDRAARFSERMDTKYEGLIKVLWKMTFKHYYK